MKLMMGDTIQSVNTFITQCKLGEQDEKNKEQGQAQKNSFFYAK